MPLKYNPGEITLDQVVDKAIQEHLGINKNDNPEAFKEVKKNLLKELIPNLLKCPALAYNPKAVATYLPFFMQKLYPERTLTPQKEITMLNNSTRVMIKQLEDKELALRLEKILNENLKIMQRPESTPEEKAHALKLMIVLYMLLKDNDIAHLNQFANAPDSVDINQVYANENDAAQTEIKQNVAVIAQELALTPAQIADISAFGATAEGTHQQARNADALGMVTTTVVESALISQGAPEATPEHKPKTPFDSMYQGPIPNGDKK